MKTALILALTLSLALSACGRKGPLQAPGTPPESERESRSIF
jgi:predicted small lipoprotein YifL